MTAPWILAPGKKTSCSEPEARRPFIALVAASQHDTELAIALRDRFVAERSASATTLLGQIVRKTLIGTTLTQTPSSTWSNGALYYRLLITG